MDRVAIINSEAPECWDIGDVVGMRLQFYRWAIEGTLTSQPYWEYNVKEPAESGNHIWLEEQYLVPEASVPQLQADWDAQEPEPDVDDSLPEWANYYSNWQDYAIAEIPEAINPSLAFDEF